MENLLEYYNTFLWIMAGTAVIVFIALQFFEAGYGYLFDRRYGPPVPNQVGWVYCGQYLTVSGMWCRWCCSLCFSCTTSSVRLSSRF